ncbi:MAG TPA: hypothetical protein VFT53_07250 [Candidatus Saccharimonadales bacterium]|nr:hypothetical protein [Candidatus Saccharimonadales bacterium]
MNYYHVRIGVRKTKNKLASAAKLGLAFSGAIVALSVTGIASAAAPTTPTSYTPGDCGGKQIVNVTYQLTNDTDSGFFGNWATDSLMRSVKVFDLGSGTYCATINDTGSFVTSGPNSPQNGTPLAAGINGVINGGYVTNVFTATLSGTSPYATHGNLGTFDATAAHPSFLSYFDNASAINWTQPTWGWTYHTARNGNWVNASSGNFGDISNN